MSKCLRAQLSLPSLFALSVFFIFSTNARAELTSVTTTVDSVEIFRRTQLILKSFGVPEEENFQSKLEEVGERGSLDQVMPLLLRLDPTGQFPRFFNLSNLFLRGFVDRDVRLLSDLSISLGTTQVMVPRFRSLSGLKIALDPGHMGSKLWDDRTGKFVKDADGKKVSEGTIALQVAILLRAELEKLGAQVRITREGLSPVSKTPFEALDLVSYGRRELRIQSLQPWFQNLVRSAPNDAALLKSFRDSPELKRLFSEVSRGLYFAQRMDLDARVDFIEAFNPDLTVIIHFDAEVGVPTEHPNGTKAYIPGNFEVGEFATREERMNFLRLASQPQFSQSSYLLGQSIVDSIHYQMAIPYEGGLEGRGIIPRNLSLNRRLPGRTVTYLECSYYNVPKEFYAYASPDYSMVVEGKMITYSKRLIQMVNAIRDGLIHFTEL